MAKKKKETESEAVGKLYRVQIKDSVIVLKNRVLHPDDEGFVIVTEDEYKEMKDMSCI